MSLRNPPIDFTLGADVELIIVDGRKLVCDKTVSGKEPFGADGSGIGKVSEIRAKPSHNPLKVVNSIREIFLDKIKHNPRYLNFKWKAGSYVNGKSIGAHTHFGVNKKIINFQNATNVLDQYVGAISVLLEKKEEGRKRREIGYGFYGDFREQPHGFERRSSGSWLSCPHVASGILCLDKVVMYELLNNPSFKSGNYVNYDNFHYMQTKHIRSKFPAIWSDIQKMILYPHYKKHIDFLKFLVDNNLTFITKKDLKLSWGIINTNTESKKEEKLTTNDVWKMFKPIKINQQVEAYHNLFADEPEETYND